MRIWNINNINNNHSSIPVSKTLKNNTSNCSNTTLQKKYCTNNLFRYITFKSNHNIDIHKKYVDGYEDIELTPENTIKNSSKYLIINSVQDFLAISKTTNANNKYFILNSDLDFKDTNVDAIGTSLKPFTGIFNGDGHTIKNIKMYSDSTNALGLFGCTHNALISNLNIENIDFKGENEVGGLIGHALETKIKNININGNITGNLIVGGLIGISTFNNLENVEFVGELTYKDKKNYDIFERKYLETNPVIIGGVLGLDSGSTINNAYSKAKINSNNIAGGFVGSSAQYLPTIINNALFTGEIVSNNKSDAFIGDNKNSIIENCISLNTPINSNGNFIKIRNCINNIKDLHKIKLDDWNSNFWIVKENSMPRLKKIVSNLDYAQTFLEDVNNARELGLMKNKSMEIIPTEFIEIPIKIAQPKKYEQNSKLLEKIRASGNSSWLHSLFGKYTDIGSSSDIDCLSTDIYDEIIMEIVKNKNFPINNRFKSITVGESWGCTPIYVCSRFSKPAIFAEALKRNDIDLYKKSGALCEDVDIFEMLQLYPDDPAAFILYTSENPLVKEYIKTSLTDNNVTTPSELVKILNKAFLANEKFEFDEANGILKIPRKYFNELEETALDKSNKKYDSNNKIMLNFNDCMRNMDLDVNFKDSLGNNLINVFANLDDEFSAFHLYYQAKNIDVDLNNKNSLNETPVSQLLKSKKNQSILSDLCNTIQDYSATNVYGETALHVFAQNKNEKKGIEFLNTAIKNGVSLNVYDNNGTSPLMIAIENKYFDMTKFLIFNQIDLNACDNNGQNALHIACSNCDNIEDLKFVSLLMKQNINPFIKDINGFMPFDYLSDELKQVALLDEDDLRSLDLGCLPFDAITYNSKCEILSSSNLEESNYKLFKHQNSKSKITAISEDFFIKNIENSNYQEKGNLLKSLLKTITLKSNMDKDDNYKKIIHILAGLPHPFAKECIQKLCLNKIVDINSLNEFSETPLMSAIDAYVTAENVTEKYAVLDNIKVLVDNDVDIQALDENNQNILHRICMGDSVILLAKFLEKNININQKDKLGKNPIEYLSTNLSNKMRSYFEAYVIRHKITVLGQQLRR